MIGEVGEVAEGPGIVEAAEVVVGAGAEGRGLERLADTGDGLGGAVRVGGAVEPGQGAGEPGQTTASPAGTSPRARRNAASARSACRSYSSSQRPRNLEVPVIGLASGPGQASRICAVAVGLAGIGQGRHQRLACPQVIGVVGHQRLQLDQASRPIGVVLRGAGPRSAATVPRGR